MDYEPDNDATLWMQVNAPLDVLLDQSMEWDIEEDGVYRGSFQVEEEGFMICSWMLPAQRAGTLGRV